MKKTLFLLLGIVLSIPFYAADLAVREGGAGGAYSTIADALAVAASGDRIIVQPKAGGSAYIESFILDQNLQFLCENEGEKFIVEGNIIVDAASPLDLAFIGMELNGNLTASGIASNASRTIVKLLYTTVNGDIDFDYDNYDVTFANSELEGTIEFRAGRIIGSTLSNAASSKYTIRINDEGSSVASRISDTIQIIGNRIYNNTSSEQAILYNSSDYYFQIDNNYIHYRYMAIRIGGWRNSTEGENEIVNNTIRQTVNSTYSDYAIYCFNIAVNSKLHIYNNLFDGLINSAYSDYGIYGDNMNAGVVHVGYNFFDSGFDPSYYIYGITDDGNNQTNVSSTYDFTTGELTSGAGVDEAHPGTIYYDLDLTRNNAGCYGGSYSQENYFPAADNNANRIYSLEIPRFVVVGVPIKVEAEAFDK